MKDSFSEMQQALRQGKTPHLLALDAIRGIAACTVALCFHYQHFSPQNGNPFSALLYPFFEYGDFTVEMFFLVSGFLLAYIHAQKIALGQYSAKEFWISRLARIYPLMLLTLLTVAILQAAVLKVTGQTFVYTNFDLYHFMLNVFLLQDGWGLDNRTAGFSFNGPSWFVSVIVVCYFVFYWIFHKAKDPWKGTVYSAAPILVGITFCTTNLKFSLLNYDMGRGLHSFFAGVLTYALWKKATARGENRKTSLSCALFLAFIAFLAFLLPLENRGLFRIVSSLFIMPAALILCLTAKPLYNLLSLRPLVYLGKISYSVYLWHFPIQIAFHLVAAAFGIAIPYSSKKIFLLYSVCVLAVSSLSYHFYEKGANAWFKRWLTGFLQTDASGSFSR